MDKRVHQVRLEQWSQRIIERKNSGLTIARWCELNGFSKDAYHYWQKTLRVAALDAVGTDIAVKPSVNEDPLAVPYAAPSAFAIITFNTFKNVRDRIIFYQSPGRRHKIATFPVFAQVKDLSQFLPDCMRAVVFASGADIGSINNGCRATDNHFVFITDNLLCFDECHHHAL